MANSQDFQKKIKLLKEDLRMWKDKNEKLLAGFENDDQKRKVQSERFQVLDDESKRYQKQLISQQRRMVSLRHEASKEEEPLQLPSIET